MGRGKRNTIQVTFKLDADLKDEVLRLVPEIHKPMSPGTIRHGGWMKYINPLVAQDLRRRRDIDAQVKDEEYD